MSIHTCNSVRANNNNNNIIITVPLHKSSLYPSMCAIIIISGETILFLVTNVTDLRPSDWPPYALNYLITSSKLAWDVGILQKNLITLKT